MTNTGRYVVWGTVGTIVFFVLCFGLYGATKSVSRYQARADAQNQVQVNHIRIRSQAQRVQIAIQDANIRYQRAVGIKRAQDEIAATLTPMYIQFEYAEALKAIAASGQNNSVVFVPTNGSGIPIVPGLTEKTGKSEKTGK